MPILDLEQGLTPLSGPPDEVVTAFFRAFLPDFYFVNTPISRMRRHLQIIRDLPHSALILDFHRPAGAHFTELTLCASDDAQPGLLSKVAGTLAVLKINIHTAWIHTLRNPHEVESGRRIVLDTLILSELLHGQARPLTEESQKQVREILTPVLSGQNSVAQLLFRTLRRAQPLVIDHLTGLPANEGTCQITLRAANQEALLFRITRVLARLGLDIAHAQIDSLEVRAGDVFFVSRSGGVTIEAAEIPALLRELREGLENEDFGF